MCEGYLIFRKLSPSLFLGCQNSHCKAEQLLKQNHHGSRGRRVHELQYLENLSEKPWRNLRYQSCTLFSGCPRAPVRMVP